MRALDDILNEVRANIAEACRRAGRACDEVEILAVTKTHGPEVVSEAWRAGLRIVAENKVQEAMWKKNESPPGPSWHLIGRLQSNKVRHALETFDCIHSIDSLKLAQRVNFIASDIGAQPSVLLEVNVSGEKSKTGISPVELEPTLLRILETCPRLSVEGFMTMAPFSENPEDSRPYFSRLRELRDSMESLFGIGLPRLSMGMSGDYEVAVEEGATWLRLGTVLFGERPKIKCARTVADDDGFFAGGGLDSYSGAGPTVKILD